MDHLSKPVNELFWTRSPFPTRELGFVGDYVFVLLGKSFDSLVKTLLIPSVVRGDRSSLLPADQLCGAANEITAMHRNVARLFCGGRNDQVIRDQAAFVCGTVIVAG